MKDNEVSRRTTRAPTKKVTLKEFESKKRVLIRKIKNKFSTEKVMMMLDKEKLEALEEEFAEHPEGLELDNFVWLMKSAMHHKPEEEYDLVHGLCKLFNEVDINGDKHMEWKEFTQYIIDAVMQNQVALDQKNEEDKKKKAEPLPLPLPDQARKPDLLEQAENIKMPRLYQSKVVDKYVHLGYVQKAVFCNRYDMLLAVENMQKELKIFSPEFKLKMKLEPPFKREAFLLSCSYDNERGVFGCVASDSCMYFWESQLSVLNPRLSKSLNAPCIQTGLWYLEKHKTWISVGKDNVVREWDIFRGSTADCLLASFEEHEEEIMDVCEIHSPMALATASFDRTIRIYNLLDKTAIGVLKEHKTGVRSLNYTPFHGGNILSVGHENYINVWSPEGSIVRSHVGKLEGHNAPCVSAKFINQTPFCVSVDEKLNLRIWDIRNQQCQQIISYESKSKLPIFGLLIYPEEKKFAVLSKRFLLYDTVSPEEHAQRGSSVASQKQQLQLEQFNNGERNQKDQNKESIYAIDAHFNRYYLSFNVVTKNEIRTYDGLTGKLVKVFSEVVDKRTHSDLSAFCLDNRHRKCYLGDSYGSVRVFNISNGVFIKHVNNDDDEEVRKKRMAALRKDKSKEISGLEFVYFEEYLMLLSSAWDSNLAIYDEQDPDETFMLRKVKGGHFKDDISAMAFSEHLSLISTGSRSGIVCVWDFETCKLEGICLGQKRAVTTLTFVKSFPLLISAGSCGIITIWGVRPLPSELKYVCFGRFVNLGWDGQNFSNVGVTGGFVRVIEQRQDESQELEEEDKYRYQRGAFVKEEAKEEEEEGEEEDSDTDSFIEQAWGIPSTYRLKEGQTAIDLNDKIETFVTEFTKIKSDNDHEERTYHNSESSSHFPKYLSPFFFSPQQSGASTHSDSSQPKLWFIFGDEEGCVKHWDFSAFIHAEDRQLERDPPRVVPVKQFREGKLSYNPMRREKLDVKNIAPSYLHNAKISQLPPLLDGKMCVQFREQKAHKSQINTIREIKYHPFGYITTSLDKHVKVFSMFGELWGDIYLLKESYEKNWWFPYRWKDLRNKEVDQARLVLDQIRKAQDEKERKKGRVPEKQESFDEVVEFDDELEHMMKEQEAKAHWIKQKTLKGGETKFAPLKVSKNASQASKAVSQNTSIIEAVPQFYVSSQNQFLSKDFGQTEEYKRKIKRLLEGPPKFYTGFVFDLEQDILALQQKGKHESSGKGPKVMMASKDSMGMGGASKQSLKIPLKQPLTTRTKLYHQEEISDTLMQSKYFQVTENLKNKYLSHVDSNKPVFSPTSQKDSSKIKSQQTSPQNIKVVDEQEIASTQVPGFMTERLPIAADKKIISNQNHYLPSTTLRPFQNQATLKPFQNQTTLKPLTINSKATSQQVTNLSHRQHSTDYSNRVSLQSIPSYALKTTKRIQRLQSQDSTPPNKQQASPMKNAASVKTKTLARQKSEIMNNRKRKLIVGFEVNKNQNGNFLRKLDKMIEVGPRPRSRLNDNADMKFQPGEGGKQLTKAILALNNKKYSQVSNLNDCYDNNLLISSRSNLKEVAERNKVLTNQNFLNEQERRRKEAHELKQISMITIFNQKN